MSKPDPAVAMSKPDLQSSPARPLFLAMRTDPQSIKVEVDGIPVTATAQDSVASLLLRTYGPETYRRSPVSGLPRAPLCMMGVCFECLVEIDGQTNQQGCLVKVREGMRIRRQLSGGLS
jgi:predicted molibdopterin-dependent oxidoreductase YjgC